MFSISNPLGTLFKKWNITGSGFTTYGLVHYDIRNHSNVNRNNNKPLAVCVFAVGKPGWKCCWPSYLYWPYTFLAGSVTFSRYGPFIAGNRFNLFYRRWRLIEKQIDWKLVKQILIISSPFILKDWVCLLWIHPPIFYWQYGCRWHCRGWPV